MVGVDWREGKSVVYKLQHFNVCEIIILAEAWFITPEFGSGKASDFLAYFQQAKREVQFRLKC